MSGVSPKHDNWGVTAERGAEELTESIPMQEFECPVCLELLYYPVVLPCGHVLCFWCTFLSMSSRISNCPLCRYEGRKIRHRKKERECVCVCVCVGSL